MENRDILRLVDRCGEDYVSKRLRTQVEHSAGVLGPGLGSFHFENLERCIRLFGRAIRLFGGWNRGTSNIKAHKIVVNRVNVPRLPKVFNGIRILHLSDLHLDVMDGMGAHVGRLCASLKFDLALITGDFRFHTHGNYYPVFREIEILAKHLTCKYGCYGILGNHDFLEFVPKLEAHGVQMLLNESATVELDGSRFWIVGLDDAHFYGVHDYAKAFTDVPKDDTKILMIHSPETLEDAYNYGTDFVLSGHTHGGQICLPGGIALWLNADCPKNYCKGSWNYRGMPGYTSGGTGSSGLPIRFNCPPEITLHHLMSMESTDL